MNFLISIGIWVLLSWFGMGDVVRASQDITIVHSSEHHGVALPLVDEGPQSLGGFAGRATIIRNIEREGTPVLLVDTGDLLIGTAMSSWFRGEPDILAMNLLRYDAMVAGNHDFDYGLGHLQTLRDLADFPMLCTNLRSQTDTFLPCQRYFVTRLGKLSVGILGVVGNSNFPETFNPEVAKVLKLIDPVQAVQAQVRTLQKELGVQLIVVLTHQNTDEDLHLLQTLENVDVIIGGHTEGFDGMYVPDSVDLVDVHDDPKTVYVKTHRQGRTIGRLDLTVDKGKIVRASAVNIPITASTPPDPRVADLLSEYRNRFSKDARQVIGHTLVRLQGDRHLVRTQETNLGNLLADLIRKRFGCDVALINGGQIRGSLEAGDITFGDVLAVLPFHSSLVTLELPGEVLWQVFEHSVSRLPNHDGRFLQVSGVQAIYNLDAPVGHRLQKLRVGNRPLQDDQWYSVVTDVFMADGGDGYQMFSQAAHRIDRQLPLRDVFHQALLKGPVQAALERRLVFHPGSRTP